MSQLIPLYIARPFCSRAVWEGGVKGRGEEEQLHVCCCCSRGKAHVNRVHAGCW